MAVVRTREVIEDPIDTVPPDEEEVLATRKDVIDATKAIYDEVKDLNKGLLRDNEDSIVLRVCKAVDAEYEKRFAELRKQMVKNFEEVKSHLVAEFKSQTEQYITKTMELQGSYAAGLEYVKSLLAALPEAIVKSAPVVNFHVPENAILVKQLPSQVVVTEKAFNLQLEQAPAPVVNVSVPEVRPEVTVSVPQRRLVRKSLSYDEYGRPVQIDEQEVDE